MRESSRISELRVALRRQGVWGMRAERLLQDWTEHVRDDAAHRVAVGGDPSTAEEAAWQALGGPDILAAAAGCELTRASWLGRHPWLGGAAFPALTWLLVTAAVTSIPWLMNWIYLESNEAFSVLNCWQHVFNWLPWLLSMAWLARIAARMPGGWKLFWVTAAVLTLCSTSLQMSVYPPLHGPGSGSMVIHTSGFLGLIAMTIARVLGFGQLVGSWEQVVSVSQMVPWLQTAIIVLGIAFFRFKVHAPGNAWGFARPLDG